MSERATHETLMNAEASTGLFVDSGVVIRAARPGAVISFALTGAFVVLVMRMLGEQRVS